MVYLSQCNYEQIRNELEAFSTGWLYAFTIKRSIMFPTCCSVWQCRQLFEFVGACVLIFIASYTGFIVRLAIIVWTVITIIWIQDIKSSCLF